MIDEVWDAVLLSVQMYAEQAAKLQELDLA